MNIKFFSCFLFLVSCFCISAQAQTDGTQYPITDPRNPNCPCHKQQQQADEEYRQLLNNAQVSNINKKNIDDQPLIIPNQMTQINEDENIEQQDNNIEPLIGVPAINKPEIGFPVILRPSFGGGDYSGGSYKFKKHSVKKLGFKILRRIKKIFQRKKKIKIIHTSCFDW